MKIKNIITTSGHRGWQAKLQDVYVDFAEFLAYCVIYKIHTRLGYRTAIGAWKSDPVIQGSIFPSDLRRVTLKEVRK
jgi:hypothetical protein